MPQSTIWKLEPHTRAKHALLRRYLGGWYAILSRFNGRVLFFDGFAGPGIYEGGEAGSPVIALETLLDHSYGPQMARREFLFLFNEADKPRYDRLVEVLDRLRADRAPWPANVKVQVVNAAFQETAQQIVDRLAEQKASLAPTFAFVDPFGVKGLPLALLSQLVAFDKCEVLVYFDFNTVNRFGTSGQIDRSLTDLFGTDRYREAAGLQAAERKRFFHDLYQNQLKSMCGFRYVQSFEMVNARDRTGYYLFFGTRSLTGLRVMKEAMWKVDPGGGFRFSDVLADQEVLFGSLPDTLPLQRDLARHFAGRSVRIAELEEYVLAATPYIATHLKKQTLKPMQDAGAITCVNQTRMGTYPATTLVTFPLAPVEL